jgi:DNA recombination protein RmuC
MLAELLSAAALVVGVLVLVQLRRQKRTPLALPPALIDKLDLLDRDMGRGGERMERLQLQQSRELREELAGQLNMGQRATLDRLDWLRDTVEEQLRYLQEDNGKKLEQMRATVDEKLQGTLEKRLGESFKLVSERLEEVQRGLGEMRSLAVNVGDLRRVLGNVKTRGGWGEVQLGAVLEEMFTPQQLIKNFRPRHDSGEVVEFALRMPGQGLADPLHLPIDAKFPIEDYDRLRAAEEAGDEVAMLAARKQLDVRLKSCARDISEKYIVPPVTTDFALLYVPTEGLYGEALRGNLLPELQRKYRVVVVGPTTLTALLSSLQLGFRTLAVEQRSGEVMKLLGTVKAEVDKFGVMLSKVKEKLSQAHSTIEGAEQRTRVLSRHLHRADLAEPDTLLPHASSALQEVD